MASHPLEVRDGKIWVSLEDRGASKKMKSAYELAMERLEQKAPTKKLTDEQKARIAEINSLYGSKIAEKEDVPAG